MAVLRTVQLAFFSSEAIANRVGLGVGIGLSSFSAGLMFGMLSREEAEKQAIKGQVGKAMWKIVQASAQAAIGMGTSGVASGLETSGTRGAVIGGIAGSLLGLSLMARSGKSMRELGIVYRDLIIPTKDPRNFPQHGITRDPRFNEYEVDSFTSGVYVAPSIGSMKGFRQEQVENVLEKSDSMPSKFKNPEIILGRMRSAIFIIPNISHYPAFDPGEDRVMFDNLNESSEGVHLGSPDGKLIAEPCKGTSGFAWPYTTEFQVHGKFSYEQWQYWREISWKRGTVILAERKNKGREKGSESPKLIAEDKYFLIDILLDQSERGIKRRREEPERVKELTPAWEPSH